MKLMNCTDINTLIDEYLDGNLAGQDLSAFQQHIDECSHCTSKLEQIRSLDIALHNLDVPEPSKNFEQRVFTEVRRQYKDHHRRHFISGFSTAIAASLAIWFASTVFMTGGLKEDAQIVSIAVNEVKTVRLLFDSHTDLAEVNLSIDLPANMQVDGFPGQHELSWQTSLKKGENVLELPLIATEYGQGELVAKLNYGDKEKILRVVLKSSGNGVLYYHLDEKKLT